jgi:formyl-CoA transferase
MSITGLPGQGPVRVGIPIDDLCAGLLLAQAILMALIEREQSGEGQWVHTSLLEAQIFMLDFQASRWLIAGEVAKQAGNDHPTGIPTGLFPTSDGPINIAASGDNLWRRFCEAADAQFLLSDPDYKTGPLRSKNRKALNEVIAEITRKRPSAYWVELLNEVGVPCGPLYTIDQTFADPQVRHLGIAQSIPRDGRDPITLVGQPVHLSRTPSKLETATPENGEHSAAILDELGFSAAEIAAFRERGAI